MQSVSKAYKSQIKKVPFRNGSYCDVIVGVINKEAQKRVKFSDGDYIFYSNLELPFTNEVVDSEYATYEENYFIPNGAMSFIGEPYTNQGAVSEERNESIKIDMGDTYSLAGLTIDFGTKYPVEFNLIIDNETRHIVNDKRVFIHIEPLTTRYIEIEPIAFLNGGSARLRIEGFKCGYYKYFTNHDLISVDYEEAISPISAEISQNTATIKTENFGRKFDVEMENDLTKFMIVGQDVNINFGYQLNDGSIEYVDLGNLSLLSWEIDSTTLVLKATSYLNTLDEICRIGEYSESGKTLYALAEEVFNDLEIEDYKIDARMKEFISHNPLPQLPHAQLLQVLSNAGQCTVLRDRKGTYKILPTAFINSKDITFNIYDNGHTALSDITKIIDIEGKAKTNYIADYSQNYFRVSGEMYFSGNDNQGYISSMVSDNEGYFETNPLITIEMSKPLQLTGWTFDFVGAVPEIINIKSYYNDMLVEDVDFFVNQQIMPCQDNFGYCDKVVVEIIKGSPNARVHISQILTPPIVFTFTTERDVINSPKAKIEDMVKMVELETTIYTPEEATEEAFKQEITIEDGIDYEYWEVIFNSPIIPDKFYVNDVEIQPLLYSGQHCIVDLSTYAVDDVLTFRVSGKQLTSKAKTYRNQINEKGTTTTYQNPMIDNDKLAKNNLIWLGVYSNYNKKYTISSRGYPELEMNDLVGLEIPQLNKITTLRLTSQKISFSGGALKGTNTGIKEE